MEDVDAEWMERVEKAEVEERYRRGGDFTITRSAVRFPALVTV
jgi:hypothetical protein